MVLTNHWLIRLMLPTSAIATIGSMRTHTKRRRRSLPGIQHLWGFDNGHLASVVPDNDNTRLWQLALHDGSGRPTTATVSLGANTIGSLRPIDVRRILREIEAFP